MSDTSTFADLIQFFIGLGLKLIPLLGVIALLVFVLGVGRFIKSTQNEKEIEKTKNLLIWGVVGLFVLFTIWGIVTFIRAEFGFGGEVGIPQFNTTGTSVDSNIHFITPN